MSTLTWRFDEGYGTIPSIYYNVHYLVRADSDVAAVWQEQGKAGWQYGVCGGHDGTGAGTHIPGTDSKEETQALCVAAYWMR